MSDTGSGGLPPAGTVDNTVQNTLLAGGGLALLALVAVLGLDICFFCGPPEKEVIAVTIDKSCVGRVDQTKTANQKDRDILVWRIESECATQQKVLICAHPQGGAPPLQCLGDPRNAVLEKPFPVDAAQSDKVRSYIICPLEWPTTGTYKYEVEVLTEAEITPLTCQGKNYELALEVLP